MTPTTGRMKIRTHQRILWSGGRFDLRISTANGCQHLSTQAQAVRSLTPCQHVDHEDDESKNTASGAILPGIGLNCKGGVAIDGGCEGEGGEAQLEEKAEHGGGYVKLLFGFGWLI